MFAIYLYSKTCVKQPLSKRQKISFQDQLSLNAGQKNSRMLQGEHSAILSTFIKLPFVINNFLLSILSGRFTQVLLYSVNWYADLVLLSKCQVLLVIMLYVQVNNLSVMSGQFPIYLGLNTVVLSR